MFLPPYEYVDELLDRRTPRPPHRAADIVLTRPRRRRRLRGWWR